MGGQTSLQRVFALPMNQRDSGRGSNAEESGAGGAQFHGIFCKSHPLQVPIMLIPVPSKAARYLSYTSRKLQSMRDEKISSPRGFVVSGIDGIRTAEDERFPSRVGEGDLARLEDIDPLEGEEGRGKG
jgi:hypothetical protein